ncbi:MAG: metallophosphoesterase [Chitinophagales bacterium]|nr:metallophosphoesterase [Chitinophagales bacterium]
MPSLFFISLSFLIYGAIEYYGWQAFSTALRFKNIEVAKWIYWGITVTLLAVFFAYRPFLYKYMPKTLGVYFSTLFVILLLTKLIVLLFLFPEDIVRLAKYAMQKFSAGTPTAGGITRSEFLSRLAIFTAAIPAGSLLYGVVVNAYNYQFRKVTIKFPNLPESFNGFRIIQLSDIHSGSFTKTEPVAKAIDKINATGADLIVFTGDLVNNVASEMEPFMDVFNRLQAKHGVISVTGNHDYGDYVEWETPADKRANFEQFKNVHKQLGWDLLLNENRVIEKDGEKIAVLGVENWGKGRFAKYGKFEEAYKGIEGVPFKILLSHDPSSWDEKVKPAFTDIDLTLSGHTHGAQFGVENKWLRWSPSQYIYKQWAGLYNEGKQFLYVNRGFGFLGYPGRVGILPEVTEITLVKG